MTRFSSSSQQALSEQPLLAYRQLVDMGVTSGYVYFCSGRQFLYFNSTTYTPVGGLGEISGIEEESDVFPRDVTFRLCGINTLAATGSLSLYEPLREDMFNRPVRVYGVFLETQGLTMPNSAELRYTGKIAAVNVKPMEGEYEVRTESALRKSAPVMYFNRETFRAVDSSDTAGDHIDKIPLFKSMWGGNPTYFNGNTAPPGTGGGGLVAGLVRSGWQNRYPTGG